MDDIGSVPADEAGDAPSLEEVAQLPQSLEATDMLDRGPLDLSGAEADDGAVVSEAGEVLDPAPSMDVRGIGEVNELQVPALSPETSSTR